MNAIIRNVLLDDLDQVCTLFCAAISWMKARQIDQWDDRYPTREVFADDIGKDTMFGFYVGPTLKGVVVLNTVQLPEYGAVEWTSDEKDALVMHRLCTHPRFSREGVASALVEFAERYACAQYFRSIRLDAYFANDAALRLYDKHQFCQVGKMQLRKGTFVGYEKILPCE